MRMSDQAYNRLSMLKALRAAEPISRTDLAELSGLNGGTITAIVRDLVERGLVIEERVASANRGRPRVNLRINPEGAFVAGATMNDDANLITEIVDLRGQPIGPAHIAQYAPTPDPAVLAEQFAELITQAIAASPVPRDSIAQIGIGVPAIVESRTGIIKFFETFEGLPFPFAQAIERELGIPTRVDNNVNLLARAEHWFGESTGVDDFTLVQVDLGLGGARYQQGQLLIGSHGVEAEMGHTKVVPEGGRRCHCGAQGCLQTYSSMSGIAFHAAELAGEEAPSLPSLRGNFAELAERAMAGEAGIVALFDQAARYLGRAMANHINMQDPARITVLTKSPALISLFTDPFFAALHSDTLPVLRDPERVTFKLMTDTNYARGAAAMVLEQIYLSP
ncbi:MAG TPA: ROK family transcriptional regulator [Novosphingobium sp.]